MSLLDSTGNRLYRFFAELHPAPWDRQAPAEAATEVSVELAAGAFVVRLRVADVRVDLRNHFCPPLDGLWTLANQSVVDLAPRVS